MQNKNKNSDDVKWDNENIIPLASHPEAMGTYRKTKGYKVGDIVAKFVYFLS